MTTYPTIGHHVFKEINQNDLFYFIIIFIILIQDFKENYHSKVWSLAIYFEVSYAHQNCMCLIKNTVKTSNIVLNIITI